MLEARAQGAARAREADREAQRKIVYTDFEDEIGRRARDRTARASEAATVSSASAKVRAFLNEHENHVAVAKLRLNRPLTPADLAELERMLVASGTRSPRTVAGREQSEGLGLFVRSLVGLDRAAAKRRSANSSLTGTHRRESDRIREPGRRPPDRARRDGPARLYESPFTDLHTQGVAGLFPEAKVERMVDILKTVHDRAVA